MKVTLSVPTIGSSTTGIGYQDVMTRAGGTGTANLWPASPTITYAFDSSVATNLRPAFELAMQQWSDIADITFTETTGTPNLTLYVEDLPTGIAGSATLGPATGGRLRLDSLQASESNLEPGRGGFRVLVHELGHTLGLTHLGPYNGTTATIADAVVSNDHAAYSVMSYWASDAAAQHNAQLLSNDPNTPVSDLFRTTVPGTRTVSDPDGETFDVTRASVRTPMLLDFATVQHIYGANTATRTGDDRYFHYATTDNTAYHVDEQFGTFSGVLWDNGGIDWIDVSESVDDQRVDLRTSGSSTFLEDDAGRFSSILGRQGNLFIPNAVQIEGVDLGAGDDEANARDGVATTLMGGAGADRLFGGTGNDHLHDDGLITTDGDADYLAGGAGEDHYFIGGGDTVYDSSGGSHVTIQSWGPGDDPVDIDMNSGDDVVDATAGDMTVIAYLGGGTDTYRGSSGRDEVSISMGGEAPGTGDDIDLGQGDDNLTASVSGDTAGRTYLLEGGGGTDSLFLLATVPVIYTDPLAGTTQVHGLGSLQITGFEEVSAYQVSATIVSSLATYDIATGRITGGAQTDEVTLEGDTFDDVDLGDGADLLVLDGPPAPGATLMGGAGVDRLVLLNDALPGLDQSAGGSLSDFEIIETDEMDGFTFTGHATEGRWLRLVDNTLASAWANGPGFAATFGSGDDRFSLGSLASRRSSTSDQIERVAASGGAGIDTLDFSEAVTGYHDVGFWDQYRPETFERLVIDAAGGTFSRGFEDGNWADHDSTDPADEDGFWGTHDHYLTGSFDGFETFLLPDYDYIDPLPPSGVPRDPPVFQISFAGADIAETVEGGARAETVATGGGGDTVRGNGGNDTVDAGSGADFVTGGDGADHILGGTDNDTVQGDEGNDTIEGNRGDDLLFGGTGDDSILGGAGNDHLVGYDGADEMMGQSGQDSINGGAQDDTIYGNAGSDTISGSDGADSINGGAGDDSMFGGNGNDTLRGSNGDDTAYGNLGQDELYGGDGRDSLLGGDDDDLLYGNSDSDTLLGGRGNDMLDGGDAADVLIGGDGIDTFAFASAQSIGNSYLARDRIADFVKGEDLIDLSAIDAHEGQAGDQAFTFVGTAPHSGFGATLRYVTLADKVLVYGDTDGSGLANFTLELTGTPVLSASDFIL